MDSVLPSQKILGVNITSASKSEILEYLFKRIKKAGKKFYIVTPNPEIIMHASSSAHYRSILNDAEISLADGIGVVLSGRMLKKRIIGRVTGVDMVDDICAKASKQNVTVGFLGGREGVAKDTAECLTKKYPGLIVSFVGEEWPSQNSEFRIQNSKLENSSLPTANYRQPTNKNIDILFVAFGFPKQEEWIYENLDKIPVTCAMGVGGSFDIISGRVKRAPKIIRTIGMEWAYRLVRQPWRIKRQLVLPLFVAKVLKQRFSSSKQ